MSRTPQIFILFTMIFFLGSFIDSKGQDYLMDGTPIFGCDGFFLDSGGNNGDYGPDENFTTTICSDNSGGTHVSLSFSSADLGPGDILCFYDGTTTGAPLLSCAADYQAGAAFIVQATAANTSGCVTVVFTSDSSGEDVGWNAVLSCVASCQVVLSEIISTDPAVFPADTGYIDVCVGERILLSGQGVYPQNGLVYNQSDLTSSFEWNFGDGVLSVGPNASHFYEEPGGYVIELGIRDSFGCRNINYINQRVRVSPRPTFALGDNIPTDICVGDTLNLSAIVNDSVAGETVSVVPTSGSFQSGGIRSDSLPLPDGTGATYSTSIVFQDFRPGQVLTNVNDLRSICVVMEHSYLRDLEIILTCPDGTSITLHNFAGQTGGQVFLGTPEENDEGFNPPLQGRGAEYCWTPNATAGTWIEYSNAFLPTTLPAGNYNSSDPLSDLLGCPLNGEWTISVQDLWPVDNGWIFSWSIDFNPNLYPELETFTPQIVDFGWEMDPSIIEDYQDSIVAVPQNAGTANYVFGVVNDFGCAYDTAIQIPVLPPTHPDCYTCNSNVLPLRDTTLCAGDTLFFDGTYQGVIEQAITFESFPNYEFGFTTHPPNNAYNAEVDVSGIIPSFLTDPINQIVSVCLDITHTFDSDLDIYLEAPSGERLELTTDNGGGGDNYTGTCFTPAAANPINAGIPPFTGSYQPEGNWNDLQGADIIGKWKLLVADDIGINDFGTLNSWSITFNTTSALTYSWPYQNIGPCLDCPDIIINPVQDEVVLVETNDIYGCVYTDSAMVTIVSALPAPNVVCQVLPNGEIVFNWPSIIGATDVEVNLNNLGWSTGPAGDSLVVTGLMNGDTAFLQVRGLDGCEGLIGSAYCTYFECAISAQTQVDQNVICNGSSDGIATVTPTAGDAPFTFNWNDGDNQDMPQNTGLSAGTYYVTIIDANMCLATDSVLIVEPDPFTVQFTADSVSCFGMEDGSVEIIALGGTPDNNGDYVYQWNDPANQVGSLASNLAAADYEVIVIDDLLCRDTFTITVGAPPSVQLTMNGNPATCFNRADGEAAVMVAGGNGGYTFEWNDPDNQNSATASNLLPDTYTVTVRDAAGCEAIDSFVVDAPSAIIIDTIFEQDISCYGEGDGSLEVVASGGTGVLNYTWNDPLGQTGPNAVLLQEGPYEVLIVDGNMCQLTGFASVAEPDSIDIQFTIEDVNCYLEETGSVTVNASGGTGMLLYSWDDPDNQITADAVDLGAGNYTLEITDANMCQAFLPVTINQPNSPLIVTATQTQIACFGTGDGAASLEVVGGTPNYTFNWSNGTSDSTILNLGTGTVIGTVIDANNCVVKDTIEIIEYDSISASVLTFEPSCYGLNDGSFALNAINGGSANGDVTQFTIDWDVSPSQSGLLVDNLLGNTTYFVEMTDTAGCANTLSFFMPEPDSMVINLTGNPVLCYGDTTGSATVANVMGGAGVLNYQWDSNANSQISQTASGLAIGDYTVTVTDLNNCEQEATTSVSQPDSLMIEFESQNVGCAGDSTGSVTVIATGGVGGYSYLWSNGATNPALEDLEIGIYDIVVEDANNCSIMDSVDLLSNEPLFAHITLDTLDCYGDNDGYIEIEGVGGVPPYYFSIDGSDFSTQTQYYNISGGSHRLNVEDASGCFWEGFFGIVEPPPFEIDAGSDIEVDLLDTTQLQATLINNIGIVTIQWSSPYDSTLSCMDCLDPLVYTENTVLYRIVGVDENGCTADDFVLVRVRKDQTVLVPTGFSPNGDGTNDLLSVFGKEEVEVSRFQIFDRWGELVYDQIDFPINQTQIGWDGTHKGQELNAGVYVWVIDAVFPDGATASFKGQTTMIR